MKGNSREDYARMIDGLVPDSQLKRAQDETDEDSFFYAPPGMRDADVEMSNLQELGRRTDELMRKGICPHGWYKTDPNGDGTTVCQHCGKTWPTIEDAWEEFDELMGKEGSKKLRSIASLEESETAVVNWLETKGIDFDYTGLSTSPNDEDEMEIGLPTIAVRPFGHLIRELERDVPGIQVMGWSGADGITVRFKKDAAKQAGVGNQEFDKHELILDEPDASGNAQAHCSCGGWRYRQPSDTDIESEFEKHRGWASGKIQAEKTAEENGPAFGNHAKNMKDLEAFQHGYDDAQYGFTYMSDNVVEYMRGRQAYFEEHPERGSVSGNWNEPTIDESKQANIEQKFRVGDEVVVNMGDMDWRGTVVESLGRNVYYVDIVHVGVRLVYSQDMQKFAAAAGELKPGDKVTVKGQEGTVGEVQDGGTANEMVVVELPNKVKTLPPSKVEKAATVAQDVACPNCGSTDTSSPGAQYLWHRRCNACRAVFDPETGQVLSYGGEKAAFFETNTGNCYNCKWFGQLHGGGPDVGCQNPESDYYGGESPTLRCPLYSQGDIDWRDMRLPEGLEASKATLLEATVEAYPFDEVDRISLSGKIASFKMKKNDDGTYDVLDDKGNVVLSNESYQVASNFIEGPFPGEYSEIDEVRDAVQTNWGTFGSRQVRGQAEETFISTNYRHMQEVENRLRELGYNPQLVRTIPLGSETMIDFSIGLPPNYQDAAISEALDGLEYIWLTRPKSLNLKTPTGSKQKESWTENEGMDEDSLPKYEQFD